MRRRGVFFIALLGVVVLVLVGGALLHLQPWDEAAERVSQERAARVLDEARSSSTTAAERASATSAPASSSDAAAGLDGTWQLAPGVASEVGFRIDEVLGGIGAKTVVARTGAVTATMTIAGTTVSGVRVEADLTGLRTDSNRRDNAIRSRGLETDTYPRAAFTQSEPMQLPSVPPEGTPVSGTIKGSLELHGVTRAIEVPVEARLDGGIIVVTGSQTVTLTDYGMEKPTGGPVLSIEDTGDLELQLFFAKSAQG